MYILLTGLFQLPPDLTTILKIVWYNSSLLVIRFSWDSPYRLCKCRTLTDLGRPLTPPHPSRGPFLAELSTFQVTRVRTVSYLLQSQALLSLRPYPVPRIYYLQPIRLDTQLSNFLCPHKMIKASLKNFLSAKLNLSDIYPFNPIKIRHKLCLTSSFLLVLDNSHQIYKL